MPPSNKRRDRRFKARATKAAERRLAAFMEDPETFEEELHALRCKMFPTYDAWSHVMAARYHLARAYQPNEATEHGPGLLDLYERVAAEGEVVERLMFEIRKYACREADCWETD